MLLVFNFEERFDVKFVEFLTEKNEGIVMSQLINKPSPSEGSSSSVAPPI